MSSKPREAIAVRECQGAPEKDKRREFEPGICCTVVYVPEISAKS